MWDTIKRPNLLIIGIREGEESQDNGTDQIFNRIIEENFPKSQKDIHIQIQEMHRIPTRHEQKRNSSHHIMVKMLDAQNKGRILKATREKQKATYKAKPIRNIAGFSLQMMKVRRAQNQMPLNQ